MTLRDRKKERTRAALIEAAWRLFRAKGFDATTVDEIAEAAETSRSTFFRYFPTKEAAVFPYQRERVARLEGLIRQHEGASTPFEAVRQGLLEMGRQFMDIREELVLQRLIVAGSPVLLARQVQLDRKWEKVIAERLLSGVRRTAEAERTARRIAGAVFGIVEAVLRDWLDRGGRADLVKMGEEALRILEQGVGATEPFGTTKWGARRTR